MTIPSRKKRNRSGIRDKDGPVRCPQHLKWVRGFMCAVGHVECSGPVEAAHVRSSGDGGMGMKPGDNWTIPLCSFHHQRQHATGERFFETFYRVSMKDIAVQLWACSPHRLNWERKNRHG